MRCHLVNHLVPHANTVVHLMRVPKQEKHQLIHPFSHSHSLSLDPTLSHSTLSPTPEREEGEGEVKKGGRTEDLEAAGDGDGGHLGVVDHKR